MAWPSEFTIKVRRDSSTEWADANPVLAQGETGWETDTQLAKTGDGITAWNDMPYTGSTFYSDTSGTQLFLDARIPGARNHTMTGNTTVRIEQPPTGRSLELTLAFRQDSTGGRTVGWPGAIRWLAGSEPTIKPGGNALTVVALIWVGEWLGRVLE